MNLMIDQYELKKDLVTYRGMSFNDNDAFVKELEKKRIKLDKEKEPVEFIDKGFVSVSRKKEVAFRYANKGNGNIKVICSYVLGRGVKAMPLNSNFKSSISNEDNELVLKSSIKSILTRVDKNFEDGLITCKCIINIVGEKNEN